MAFRSLTDVYILMRNNVIANKNIFHDNQVILKEINLLLQLNFRYLSNKKVF
jgi:hypothetical protein